jgi:hypothetical protein
MRKPIRYSMCMLQLASLALIGAAGCVGPTTSQPVPTVNGTYDRSRDPGASNASGGTTRMREPTPPPVITSAEVLGPPAAPQAPPPPPPAPPPPSP